MGKAQLVKVDMQYQQDALPGDELKTVTAPCYRRRTLPSC
jgi:hypothetical protein